MDERSKKEISLPVLNITSLRELGFRLTELIRQVAGG